MLLFLDRLAWLPRATALLTAVGLGTATFGAAQTESLPATLPDQDERALLLLLVDRQIYERFSVNRGLGGGVELRRELAASLGRIGAAEGRPVLERLLADEDAEVRHAAVFSLGELEQPLAATALQRVATGADQPAAILAVEALAKIGVDLGEVMAAMNELEDWEVAERIMPSLYRFDKRDSLLIAARWLAVKDEALHAWAAYALARGAIPEAAVYLRPLIEDPDPWVRGWAVRALGSVGTAADLGPLRPLLRDDEEGPVIQALRAASTLLALEEVAAPADWIGDLERLMTDPRPGVRITAMEASGAWLPQSRLGARLVERYENGSPRERQVALLALAAAADPVAAELTRKAAVDSDPQVRRRAAAAAVELGMAELVLAMMSDPYVAVRADAISALLDSELRPGSEIATLAIVDASAAVRVVALRWLVDHPELTAERIVQALAPAGDDDRVDLETTVVRALAARAGTVDAEAALILETLERLGRGEEFLVRREVGLALVDMGVSPLEIGPASAVRTFAAYGEIALRTSRDRWVRMDTDHGPVTLRLTCPRAPLTCLSFLQLAVQGFFDGLTFHRVVPDFVVQGGDPSGGGWGGPGYSLRDEINRLRYETGTLGMAHSGPDTAGSQFFITLSPQPHLDGGYTVFGRVVEGMDVLHRLEQEDRITRIREVSAPSGPAAPVPGNPGLR